MANQTVPPITKIDVLEKANAIVLEASNSIGLFVVGSVDNVVLAINAVKGGWDWTPPGEEVEYHHCVRGTAHYQFKYGDQNLPPIDLNAGEIVTIPIGVACKGTCADDVVVLVMERIKPWHVDARADAVVSE
jgi:hypothetical protein